MEVVGPILDILIRICDCIARCASTIRNVRTNKEALENALEQLKNVSEDVKRRLQLEEERQMVRRKQVDSWLQKVEEIKKSVGDVLEKANQMPQRICCLSCPNRCWSSYKLGEEVKEKLRAVEALKNEGKFDSVADALPRGLADERPLDDTVGLNLAFGEVQKWIKNSQVKVIGIYGMGGVGKTTLLKKINNDFVRTSYGFDQVIWVVVSKQSTVEKVQEAICEQLRLPEGSWKNKSEDEKAVQIFRILRKKKFVLMLDDVWKYVDLVKVGIPISDDQRMSKIIFTTRYEDVCGYMGANKKMKIECLAREEALTLFRKKVGTSTLSAHPSISKLSEIVAEKCKGLPLALITVGRAMAGKRNPRDWDRAVMKLRKDPSRIMGMDDDVFYILKFSYDSLPNDTTKSCFAYCCIYPEDSEIFIDDVLDLWIGEGFLDEFDDVHKARDQGRETIEGLKAASLLEKGKSEEYVKMHDVVRDMALWISDGSKPKTNGYLVLDHTDLLEAHIVTSKMEAEKVSLWGSNIRNLPEVQSWPKALTFLIRHSAIRMFPPRFLQSMPALKVLDLSYNFHLTELPYGVGELVELQLLNLANTRIRELPLELKNLTKMKYLLLNATYRMEVIPREVISSFLLLRVFRLSGSKPALNDDSEHNILSGSRNDLLEELERLQHINDVSITLFDVSSIEKLKCSRKIQSCLSFLCLEQCEGLASLELSSSSVERMQHLQRFDIYYCELRQLIIYSEPADWHGVGISPAPDFVMRGCFRNLHSVCISYCDRLLDLTWLIHAPALELLDVAHCASMVEIVKAHPSHITGVEAEVDSNIFSHLKRIRLINVPYLKSIYPRPLPFPSLAEIHVGACHRLRRLPFDLGSAQGSLKEIRGALWWWDMLEWDAEALKPRFRAYYVPEGPIW